VLPLYFSDLVVIEIIEKNGKSDSLLLHVRVAKHVKFDIFVNIDSTNKNILLPPGFNLYLYTDYLLYQMSTEQIAGTDIYFEVFLE